MGSAMRVQKTLFTLVAVLLLATFVGMYGHAAFDDHGAEEVCQICVFLQTGASVGMVFVLTMFLSSHVFRVVVIPRCGIFLSFGFPGRSPPVV